MLHRSASGLRLIWASYARMLLRHHNPSACTAANHAAASFSACPIHQQAEKLAALLAPTDLADLSKPQRPPASGT